MTILYYQKESQYTLTVKAQDLNGKPEGNSATGTVVIKVEDVNDHLPTLEKEEVFSFLTLLYVSPMLI